MRSVRFNAVILDGHKLAAVEVPFDPEQKWGAPPSRLRAGRNGHRVLATLNGVDFEGAVVPRMRRFWLEIPEDIREAAQAEIGETVSVALKPAEPGT